MQLGYSGVEVFVQTNSVPIQEKFIQMFNNIVSIGSVGMEKESHEFEHGPVVPWFVPGLEASPHFLSSNTSPNMDQLCGLDIISYKRSCKGVVECPIVCPVGIYGGVGTRNLSFDISIDTARR